MTRALWILLFACVGVVLGFVIEQVRRRYESDRSPNYVERIQSLKPDQELPLPKVRPLKAVEHRIGEEL